MIYMNVKQTNGARTSFIHTFALMLQNYVFAVHEYGYFVTWLDFYLLVIISVVMG